MLFFVAVVAVAVYSFVALGKTRRENARYDALIASLKEEEKKLNDNISVVSSSDYKEEQVRSELKLIKSDEGVYIINIKK